MLDRLFINIMTEALIFIWKGTPSESNRFFTINIHHLIDGILSKQISKGCVDIARPMESDAISKSSITAEQ